MAMSADQPQNRGPLGYNVNLHWPNDQEFHFAALRILTSLGLMLVAMKNYNIGLQYDYCTYNIGLDKACTYPSL